MGTIRFELRKDMVSKKSGKAPVRIVYQTKGERVSIPTDIKLNAYFSKSDPSVSVQTDPLTWLPSEVANAPLSLTKDN